MKTALMHKIDGFDNYYVSKEGEVMCTDFYQQGKCKTLKQSVDKDGYKVVGLFKDGKHWQKRVHRLVAETFIPNPDNLPVINHKDEDKSNNHVDNLEWCTVKYNNSYGSRLEKLADKMGKTVYGYNEEGELVKTFNSTMEGKRNGYHHIGDCCNGKRNYSKGLKWSYEKL